MKDNEAEILSETPVSGKNTHLKIEVRDGCLLTFHTSPNGKNWVQLLPDTSLDAGYLVRWDRVARPGLIHIGKTDSPAEFSYFRMQKLRKAL